MKDNPRADWSIADVQKLCASCGMSCSPATRGSHYKVTSPVLSNILTVPFKRPIKPRYIKELVNMAEAHSAALRARKGE